MLLKEKTRFRFVSLSEINSTSDPAIFHEYTSSNSRTYETNIHRRGIGPNISFINFEHHPGFFYNQHIMVNAAIESCADLKDTLYAKINNKPVRSGCRLVVHLNKNEESNIFSDRNSSFVILLNRYKNLFKVDHSYLLEIDFDKNITNVIYDSTTKELVNRPSWYYYK
jgi:hypothetical protein